MTGSRRRGRQARGSGSSEMDPAGRRLIVNADDFGRSHSINRGVARAHEHGIVTSASLMVRWPAAAEAAAYAREHPHLSVGLHVDLGEWVYRDGSWAAVYEVVPEDRAAIQAELASQLSAYRSLVGRNPTHLDSHQHVHRSEPFRSVLVELADELAIPLRDVTPHIGYCSDFHGQSGKGEPVLDGISVARLVDIIRSLPPGDTELGCHPGEEGDLESVYRHERAAEVDALCAPEVRAALIAEGVQLVAFGAV